MAKQKGHKNNITGVPTQKKSGGKNNGKGSPGKNLDKQPNNAQKTSKTNKTGATQGYAKKPSQSKEGLISACYKMAIDMWNVARQLYKTVAFYIKKIFGLKIKNKELAGKPDDISVPSEKDNDHKQNTMISKPGNMQNPLFEGQLYLREDDELNATIQFKNFSTKTYLNFNHHFVEKGELLELNLIKHENQLGIMTKLTSTDTSTCLYLTIDHIASFVDSKFKHINPMVAFIGLGIEAKMTKGKEYSDNDMMLWTMDKDGVSHCFSGKYLMTFNHTKRQIKNIALVFLFISKLDLVLSGSWVMTNGQTFVVSSFVTCGDYEAIIAYRVCHHNVKITVAY